MIGFNGGLIGAERVITNVVNSVPGVWNANEQVTAKRVGRWPPTVASLLLHGDGTNGSTTFTDDSSNKLTVTGQGNAQISTAQSRFGGSSILLDGNGDYLSIANNNVFNFGVGNFTIEMWIRAASLSNSPFLYQKLTPGGNGTGWFVELGSSGQIYFGNSTTGGAFATWAGTGITTNTWHNITVTRVGFVLSAFVNGTLLSSQASSQWANSVDNTEAVAIGSWRPTNTAFDFNGYIDELRITKGVARYTTSFTPSATAFPNE